MKSKWVAALSLCLFCCCARATMLVVVSTDDGSLIGADSTRSGSDTERREVCKIHPTKFGILLKAGASHGITMRGDQYSTDKEVEDLVEKSRTPEEFKAALKKQFKADIDDELAYLMNDTGLTGDIIESQTMGSPLAGDIQASTKRMVLLFGPSQRNQSGEALEVIAESDEIGHDAFGRTGYKYWAPAVLSWAPIPDLKQGFVSENGSLTWPPSVKMFAYKVQYNKSDQWVRAHPSEAIKEILELGHGENPKEIGPPYVILHVITGESQTLHWDERGKCPSWSDTIVPERWFQLMRNPPE